MEVSLEKRVKNVVYFKFGKLFRDISFLHNWQLIFK